MAIGFSIVTLILLFGVIYLFIIGKSTKRKYLIWGIATLFGIGPCLSWLIGISFGLYVGSGFTAGAIMIMLYGIFFLIGLILLIIGVFKKDCIVGS